MKCPNCGAEGNGRFCQHCGTKMPEGEAPKTLAGAIHGIAKTYLENTAEKERYEREHADEIAERKRKEKREEDKRTYKGLIFFILAMMSIPAIAILLGRLAGLE